LPFLAFDSPLLLPSFYIFHRVFEEPSDGEAETDGEIETSEGEAEEKSFSFGTPSSKSDNKENDLPISSPSPSSPAKAVQASRSLRAPSTATEAPVRKEEENSNAALLEAATIVAGIVSEGLILSKVVYEFMMRQN
jgi:hypothetical protein